VPAASLPFRSGAALGHLLFDHLRLLGGLRRIAALTLIEAAPGAPPSAD
jgi:hypothetical protein